MKVYKGDKLLQGARLKEVPDITLINHYLEVMNDWLYLTNYSNGSKDYNEDNYNITNERKYLNSYSKNNQESDLDYATKFLSEYGRKNDGTISKSYLVSALTKKMGANNASNIIKILENNGNIMESSDEIWTIC